MGPEKHPNHWPSLMKITTLFTDQMTKSCPFSHTKHFKSFYTLITFYYSLKYTPNHRPMVNLELTPYNLRPVFQDDFVFAGCQKGTPFSPKWPSNLPYSRVRAGPCLIVKNTPFPAFLWTSMITWTYQVGSPVTDPTSWTVIHVRPIEVFHWLTVSG